MHTSRRKAPGSELPHGHNTSRVRRPAQPLSAARASAEATDRVPDPPSPRGRPYGGYMIGGGTVQRVYAREWEVVGGRRRPGRGGRSRSRRWCIPPAMLRSPGETLEGASILAEIPGDLGVLLWRTTRDLALWADAPPDVRGNLFADGSGDVRVVRLASTEVPQAISGIAAAAAGQDARAGTWLRRTVSLARRENDRAAYVSAFAELGALYERRGVNERAEHFYRLAYRAGRRFKAGTARMRAAHGLFRLARPNTGGSAAQFAIAAQRAYRHVPSGKSCGSPRQRPSRKSQPKSRSCGPSASPLQRWTARRDGAGRGYVPCRSVDLAARDGARTEGARCRFPASRRGTTVCICWSHAAALVA